MLHGVSPDGIGGVGGGNRSGEGCFPLRCTCRRVKRPNPFGVAAGILRHHPGGSCSRDPLPASEDLTRMGHKYAAIRTFLPPLVFLSPANLGPVSWHTDI